MLKAIMGHSQSEELLSTDGENSEVDERTEVTKLAKLASQLEKSPNFEPTSRDSIKTTNISVNSKGLFQNL